MKLVRNYHELTWGLCSVDRSPELFFRNSVICPPAHRHHRYSLAENHLLACLLLSAKFDASAILNSTGKPQALKHNKKTPKGVDFETQVVSSGFPFLLGMQAPFQSLIAGNGYPLSLCRAIFAHEEPEIG